MQVPEGSARGRVRLVGSGAILREAIGLMFNFHWTNATLFYGLYKRVNSFWENTPLAAQGKPSPEELAILDPLKAASKDLQAAAMFFMQNGMKNPNHALAGSYDFMHLFGHAVLGRIGIDDPWLALPVYSLLSWGMAEVSFRYYESRFLALRRKPPEAVPALVPRG